MARMSKVEKEADRRANSVAQSACVGFQVNVMDLSKISAKAKEAIAACMDDAAALAKVREYVATIGQAV